MKKLNDLCDIFLKAVFIDYFPVTMMLLLISLVALAILVLVKI